MNQDPISGTMATYDEIAVDYAERWQERGILRKHIDRFATLLSPGSVVCDIGCGPGFDTAVFQDRGFNAIGLDYSWGMMQAGRSAHGMTHSFVQVDMRDLPLGKTAVDGLWLCASLLHLPRKDVAPALQNFARVLKPGGILYLSVKMGEDARWMPNPYKDDLLRYFTYWQPETLDPLLIQAGFQIVDGWQNQDNRDSWLVRFAQKS
jgi:ubiquinone/menaquinone biosynthesis C-methylase UbiE